MPGETLTELSHLNPHDEVIPIEVYALSLSGDLWAYIISHLSPTEMGILLYCLKQTSHQMKEIADFTYQSMELYHKKETVKEVGKEVSLFHQNYKEVADQISSIESTFIYKAEERCRFFSNTSYYKIVAVSSSTSSFLSIMYAPFITDPIFERYTNVLLSISAGVGASFGLATTGIFACCLSEAEANQQYTMGQKMLHSIAGSAFTAASTVMTTYGMDATFHSIWDSAPEGSDLRAGAIPATIAVSLTSSLLPYGLYKFGLFAGEKIRQQLRNMSYDELDRKRKELGDGKRFVV